MRITMETSELGSTQTIRCINDKIIHLMPSISDHGTLFRESFKRMTRYEEGRLDVVLGEHLEESTDTNGPSEETYSIRCVATLSWASSHP